MYWNGSDAGSGFAVRYFEDTGTEIHVPLFQGQQFATAHTGVKQNQNSIGTRQICHTPYPVDGLPGKRTMRFDRFVLAQLQQRGVIHGNHFILNTIIQYKAYHGTYFLQGTERKTFLFHGINDLLEVHVLQFCDRHFL